MCSWWVTWPSVMPPTIEGQDELYIFKWGERLCSCHSMMKLREYLVYWACSFIVMDMSIQGYINLILLPEILKVLPSHWFFKRAFHCIEPWRRIAKYPVCKKYQPWLFLSVNRCQALFNEFILLCSFSPIKFCVSYAESEHAIVNWVPSKV